MGSDDSASRFRTAWGASPPDEEMRRFLALPVETRELALARVEVAAAFARRRPGASARDAAAARLGLSRKRLQAIVRAWRAAPGLDALALGDRRTSRPSRGGEATVLAKRIAAKAVARNRWIAEPTLTRHIARVLARVGIKAPARMTVRRILHEQRASSPLTIDDLFGQDRPSLPPRPGYPPPGEELLIAEACFAATVGDGPDRRQARALLLVDLATGHVLSASRRVGSGPPPDMAGEDRGGSIGPWAAPAVLHLAVGLGERARARLDAAAARMGATIATQLRRRAARYVSDVLAGGGPHLVVTAPARPGPVPSRWPALSAAEFDVLLADAVDRSRAAAARRFEERPHAGSQMEVNITEKIEPLLAAVKVKD